MLLFLCPRLSGLNYFVIIIVNIVVLPLLLISASFILRELEFTVEARKLEHHSPPALKVEYRGSQHQSS